MMSEARAYELLGRKQAELDNLNVEYNRLLTLLQSISAGEAKPAEISVDVAGRSWSYTKVPIPLVAVEPEEAV